MNTERIATSRLRSSCLYTAMIREIAALGDKARFKKHERGVFVATSHAGKGV